MLRRKRRKVGARASPGRKVDGGEFDLPMPLAVSHGRWTRVAATAERSAVDESVGIRLRYSGPIARAGCLRTVLPPVGPQAGVIRRWRPIREGGDAGDMAVDCHQVSWTGRPQ